MRPAVHPDGLRPGRACRPSADGRVALGLRSPDTAVGRHGSVIAPTALCRDLVERLDVDVQPLQKENRLNVTSPASSSINAASAGDGSP